MLKKGSYFPEQIREEQIVLFIRRHVLSFSFWIATLVIMIITPIFLRYFLNEIYVSLSLETKSYFIIIISAYALITLAIFISAWISYYLNVVIITPEHLVDIRQSGLFNRRVSEQSLLRVQDVSSHMRGFWQTYYRYGTVFVETAGENPNFVMPFISQPNRVANTILKLHEELVKKSGFSERDLAEGVGFEKRSLKKTDSKNNKFLMEDENLQKVESTSSLDKFKKMNQKNNINHLERVTSKSENTTPKNDKFLRQIEESINKKRKEQESKINHSANVTDKPQEIINKKPQNDLSMNTSNQNIIIESSEIEITHTEGVLKDGEIIEI